MKTVAMLTFLVPAGLVLLLAGIGVCGLTWAEVPALRDHLPHDNRLMAQPMVTGLTLERCARRCSHNHKCASFFFGLKNGSCMAFLTVHTTTDSLRHENNYRYYVIKDSKCPVLQNFRRLRRVKLCLSVRLESDNFSSSQTLCQSVGGRLPVLDSRKKNEVLVDFLKANVNQTTETATGAAIFVGARYRAGKGFVWSSGQPVVNPFHEDSFWYESTPYGHSESCLGVGGVFQIAQWLPVACSDSLPVVLCERVVSSDLSTQRASSVTLPSFYVVLFLVGLSFVV